LVNAICVRILLHVVIAVEHHRRRASRMIEVLRTSITSVKVDAIVNAANAQLRPGGGVDGAIHGVAGRELHEEQRRRYPDGCPTGEAVVTAAYRLPARYVIHAVGPVWDNGRRAPGLLESAYRAAFARALELGDVQTIAFPAISTGIYGFPKWLAAEIALRVMREHEPKFDRIVAALFDAESLRIYEELIRSAGRGPTETEARVAHSDEGANRGPGVNESSDVPRRRPHPTQGL
jgi:O-acetyl-ADP-ribose deacetylase